MNQTLLKKVNLRSVKEVPNVRTGYTVRVHQKIKEGNKERIQIFEGLIIAMNSGYGVDKTFTVRKIVSGVGVEKIFPLHSPNIAKIEVIKEAKVRRSKLYYMRERTGKAARLKETYFSEGEEMPLDAAGVIAAERNAAAKKAEEEAAKKAEAEAKKAEEEAKKAEEQAAAEAKASEEAQEKEEVTDTAGDAPEADEAKNEEAPSEEAKADESEAAAE